MRKSHFLFNWPFLKGLANRQAIGKGAMSDNGKLQQSLSCRRDRHELPPMENGEAASVEFLRFGKEGARPKVYIQTGLHADELPGMLVLRKLAQELSTCVDADKVIGEIVLAPKCNPIGLSQFIGGYMVGRVERGSDRNFNRGFPDLFGLVREKVSKKLGDDGDENVDIIRKAMRKKTSEPIKDDAFAEMQRLLVHEACDADIVLDVHADNEALLHLYVAEANWPDAQDLAAELDARAVLLTDQSGGEPFDETHGHAWVRLREAFPDRPIPQGCLSATVELRSNDAVSEEDSDRDVRGLLRFLKRRGAVAGEPGGMPRLLAEPGPLRAMQQLRAPIEGLILYKNRLGDRVRKGDVIAEIVPPVEGERVPILAETEGVLFARHDQRWAYPDKVIGKVAGREVLESRTGTLLTD